MLRTLKTIWSAAPSKFQSWHKRYLVCKNEPTAHKLAMNPGLATQAYHGLSQG